MQIVDDLEGLKWNVLWVSIWDLWHWYSHPLLSRNGQFQLLVIQELQLVRLILPIILWWFRINYSHILKGVILSYPRKRLPLEGIEPTTTIKDTHKPLIIELWCHDITSTLHGHMDLIVSLHIIFNFNVLKVSYNDSWGIKYCDGQMKSKLLYLSKKLSNSSLMISGVLVCHVPAHQMDHSGESRPSPSIRVTL